MAGQLPRGNSTLAGQPAPFALRLCWSPPTALGRVRTLLLGHVISVPAEQAHECPVDALPWWGVYRCNPDGTLDWIEDFDNRSDAEHFIREQQA